MTHTVPWDASQVLPWRAGLAYGLLGLPLAFAALPLYVVLPHYYASNLGLPLASVGALLLLVRLMDAGAEPLLGRGHHAGRVRNGIAGRLAGAVAGAASAVFSRAAGGA